MAYINGNKPIITNGLVYALDFGNPKTYTTGSNRAVSLVYDPTTTIVTGSAAIPSLVNGILNFTGSQFVQRSGSLPILDPTGSFTISLTALAVTTGSLFSQNLTGKNLGSRITTASSDFGFSLSQGNYSRTIPRTPTTSALQHITYRYSSGTIDTFINGIPVTSSAENSAILTSVVTSSLFINSGSNFFSGSLANFYVYNRALTADEIWSNYQLSVTRYGFTTASNKPYSIDENLYQWIQSTGTTDTNTISSISTFISGLKSAGLWNKLQVIYPFVGTTTGSQTINLKEPGLYRLGLTGSFSASSAGLYPSSSTSYIDSIPGTTVHPLVNSASAHLSLLSYDLPTGNGFLGGNSLPALGGDVISRSGSKVYHAFTTVGTSSFTPVSSNISNVEVMVVAGGGAGGLGIGGGGGAGGLVYSSSFTITPLTSIQVIVGAGGIVNGGTAATSATNGENTVFGSIVSIGGGRGDGYFGSAPAGSGGSGGGGGNGNATPGSGSLGQGTNGGSGSANNSGGGGGASQAGFDYNAATTPGQGGSGSYYSQFSTIGGLPSGWFAGGGGGYVGGIGRAGGNGGGGTGGSSFNLGTAGTTNTGGGGGGGGTGGASGGAGGSGIVIVGYDVSNITALTGSGTGLYLTDTAVTGSVNSQFTSGITGSGNIGLLTVSRTGSETFSIHKNNVSQSIASASLGVLSTDIFFNTANLAGSGSLPLQANLSYASIGAGLTTSEVATYTNLISQLQTNLKRKNTLLDNYTGAAAAYSLRRIGPSGYFGPAIKVRRDSDNTLRDIGFTSDGQLDTVGLLDFVGVTGSGFVQTWYDQSGNGYDATQATTTTQPYVILSGSLVSSENRVGVKNDTGQGLRTISFPSYDYLSFYDLVKPLAPEGVTTYGGYTGIGIGSYKLFFGYNSGISPIPRTVFFNKQGSNRNTEIDMVSNVRKLITTDGNSTNLIISLNNTLATTENFTGPMGGATIIGIGNGYATYPSIHQELILYTSSRRDISSNVNSNILSAYTTGSDTDYQSFITATGITQPTQSAALETLVSDLKSYGLWSKMKAIYPMVTDKNNRFAYSQALATTWNATNVYVTQSFTTAPDGTSTGNFVSESAVTDTHYIYQTISDGLVTGSEYVASIYGKFLNRPWLAMETNTGAKAWFNIQTGVTGSLTGSNATITAVSGGWYRCTLYFTSSVASGPQNIEYHLADIDGNLSYAGVLGTGSYLWGAQFENGNLVGPYRATTTVGFTTGSMLDQMKFNLKNPVDTDAAFRLVYSGNWNSGYSGVKPDGVTAYADTKLKGTSLTGNYNYMMGYYSRTITGSEGMAMGAGSGGFNNLTSFRITNTSGEFFGFSQMASFSPFLQISNPISTGLYLWNRNSSTVAKIYKNNSILGSLNAQATGDVTLIDNIYLGAFNAGGGPQQLSPFECAISTIGDGLTDYEAKALYWIVQKYQTTLGRQVY